MALVVLVGGVRLTFGGGGERLKRILGCASSAKVVNFKCSVDACKLQES